MKKMNNLKRESLTSGAHEKTEKEMFKKGMMPKEMPAKMKKMMGKKKGK